MFQVTRSIEIQAPPSEVWPFMASQDELRGWIDPGLDIDLRVGGSYNLLGADGKTRISGTVLEIVPEGTLVLSWMEEDGDWAHPARLTITLRPTSAGTEVTITHDGFAGIGKAGWSDTFRAYQRGAERHDLLQRLSRLVAAAR